MINLGNVFILGDSYSTFKNYIPVGYDTWYSNNTNRDNDVTEVEQTWWHLFLNSTDSILKLNCSWSGTTICNTGYNGEDCKTKSFIGRFEKLIEDGWFIQNKIDTFIVFGGTNDSCANSPIGELKYANWSEKDLYSALPAFCYLINSIKSQLPYTRIICIINPDLKSEIADNYREVCNKYNIEAISLHNFDKKSGHPSIEGMKQIANQVLKFVETKIIN